MHRTKTTLILIGIALIAISFVLAIIVTANTDIIGGADLSTFRFVFFRQNKGSYSMIAFVGIALIIVSSFIKSKKKT